MAGYAFFVGTILVATKIYPTNAYRHNMWLIPFVAPLMGGVFVEFINYVLGLIPKKNVVIQDGTIIIIIVSIIVLLSNPLEQSSNNNEYNIKQDHYDQIIKYLSTQHSNIAIIAEKDEAIGLINTYRYLGNDAFTGDVMATAVPYYNSYIIFNPFYHRLRTPEILLKTLAEANNKGLLNNSDTLLFTMSYPLVDLINCPVLEKEVVTIAHGIASPVNLAKATEGVFSDPAIFLLVSKKEFLEQVISETGSARSCLKEHNETKLFIEKKPAN